MREAEIERITKERRINMNLDVDATRKRNIKSGIGFFDHMLESFAGGAEATLHAKVPYGRSDNAEAMFRAFARSMNGACGIESKEARNTEGVM